MYSISIFYFTFYLFGGAYAPNAPPLPTGMDKLSLLLQCYKITAEHVVI